MLKYRKYILAATMTLAAYMLVCVIFKKPVDSLLAGGLAAMVVLVLSWLDLRTIRKEFDLMRQAVAEYVADKDVEKFIATNKNLIENSNDESVKSMVKLNLAGAYADKKDFKLAKETLDDIDLKDFGKRNYENAALNKIIIYYMIDEFEAGDRLFDQALQSDKVKRDNPLFKITEVIRKHRGSEEGLRMLSNLNMQEGIEPYRNIITTAKMIVKKG